MNMKPKLKEKAIKLRKNGLSYNEILKIVPVAKSTLSLWLRIIGLSKKQKQRLTQKKLISIKRGWEACRRIRVERTTKIKIQAYKEINKMTIDNKSLWLMGIMLYWGEGSKPSKYNISQGVVFSNQDPLMIKIFLFWLKQSLKIDGDQIAFEIYLHINYANKLNLIRKYWSQNTGFSVNKFGKIYFKKHNKSTKRHNINKDYYGLLRIRIRKSTDLNRKIVAWIEGICKKCGVV